MAPNFLKLVSRFWKLVSKRIYALTSRKYALAPPKYALTPRKYALTSRNYFKIILLRDFWTIFGFMVHPPHRPQGFTMILSKETEKSDRKVTFAPLRSHLKVETLRSLCCDSNRTIGGHGVAFIPSGTAEWLARVDCVRWNATQRTLPY